MSHWVSLTSRQIHTLDLIRSCITPNVYGTVCSIRGDDDMIEVELEYEAQHGYGKKYTRYLDSEGSVWRHDGETDKMLKADLTPEHGSYKTQNGKIVHYVY